MLHAEVIDAEHAFEYPLVVFWLNAEDLGVVDGGERYAGQSQALFFTCASKIELIVSPWLTCA